MSVTHRTIGKSVPRSGSAERLRGLPIFCADLNVGNPLTLKAWRSPRDHARILAVRTEKARRLQGVAAVFTAADVPGRNLMGIINKDQPLLAAERVRYKGDPVVLVAAETDAVADAALALIEVDFEDLPAVFDPEQALKPGAPLVHEKGNLLYQRKVRKGQAEEAFSRCRAVVERTYQTSMLEHAYLEPDSGAGFVDEEGTLVIYASTQNPHYDHQEVISLLGLAEEQVRIIQAATGGGFGSKLDLNVQGFIGLALYHLSRPVRYVCSREEAFLSTAKRHPLTICMKTGADQDGRLLAVQARILCDTGAYGSYGIAVASRAAVHSTGPYEVENVAVESLCVYTNKPFCGAMRGFGTPQIAFAYESQMDLLARELNLDPLEIRKINALRPGSRTSTGQRLRSSVGIGDCIAALRPHYEAARQNWLSTAGEAFTRKGIGFGAMWYGIGNTGMQNPSTARIEMEPEGNPTLYTGCADIGQGSSTVLLQIAAETLGLAPHRIRLVTADTRRTTNAGATSASRQTYISGNAVKDAAAKMADLLLTEAVDVLGKPKAELILEADFVRSAVDPELRIPFARLARRAQRKGLPLAWQGFFDPEFGPLDPETGQGIPYATYAFACQMALVTVDTLTGRVRVEKIVAAHDVGKAIHPEGVRGQICGGVAMGVGFALMEEFRPGETRSLKDYLIPTCADVPQIIPIIVEAEEPSGPFGAKGVGEPALIPTAPAILNAIAHALGERIHVLPASLEQVLEAGIRAGLFAPKEEEE